MATNPIVIPDDYAGYSLDKFVIPQHYEDSLESVLIPNGIIRDRVERMALNIHRDYAGKPIHFLCVMKGGRQVFNDLTFFMKRLHRYNGESTLPYSEDFITAKSYEGEQSTGNVYINGIDLAELRGKHVIIVEDIIDTGRTMDALLRRIRENDPASLKVASLLLKRTDRREVFTANK